MIIFTKAELIKKLKKIAKIGWIPNAREGNHGGIGNTLEDLLGIKENNLPIPNAAEWELKTQRAETTSLTTLFHTEPSPRAIRFVPQILLPLYGWKHAEAGKKYGKKEMSFRQTIHGHNPSDRGFMVKIDRTQKKVLISFDFSKVAIKHKKWLNITKKRVGHLNELNPQPYWGFDDLKHKAGTKLLNCFYVQAEVKTENGKEFYKYSSILMLQKFNFEGFLKAIEEAKILVDFDARTGHNHGTKFRLRQDCLPMLYEKQTVVL
ncbi:nciI [Candidatus Saganbacteria bacterium CG08_land_8_20_14_0_20_45_16]|uniref:NciI n=1 Tax=Candidatus Saganbacteria bacterium CG08_land_8_20_14_0_20_45_16 TaxID=2014293 RepID=A0A2H0XWQ4_UNCSA|nr:MAG: nciI [Candidatus Saganbacteria bacterium CG08_land_8_20_14_0_20_45_16]